MIPSERAIDALALQAAPAEVGCEKHQKYTKICALLLSRLGTQAHGTRRDPATIALIVVRGGAGSKRPPRKTDESRLRATLTDRGITPQTFEGRVADTKKHVAWYAQLAEATVLNNHFDTDGVLAVWACLEPEAALRHAALLCEGAEAGDFGEWSSDRGIQLDAAIEAIGGGALGAAAGESTDAAKSAAALEMLPSLLEELPQHEALWREGFDEATAGWTAPPLTRTRAQPEP